MQPTHPHQHHQHEPNIASDPRGIQPTPTCEHLFMITLSENQGRPTLHALVHCKAFAAPPTTSFFAKHQRQCDLANDHHRGRRGSLRAAWNVCTVGSPYDQRGRPGGILHLEEAHDAAARQRGVSSDQELRLKHVAEWTAKRSRIVASDTCSGMEGSYKNFP